MEIANGGRRWIVRRVRLGDDGRRPCSEFELKQDFGKF